jgi:hypothetical protein
MNEQLKQIAVKAKVEHCVSHVRLQEFADLIVEECARIADTAEPYKANDLIKQHFGVKL